MEAAPPDFTSEQQHQQIAASGRYVGFRELAVGYKRTEAHVYRERLALEIARSEASSYKGWLQYMRAVAPGRSTQNTRQRAPRGRQRGCRPGHRRVKTASRAGPDDPAGPPPLELERHPDHGPVNRPLRRLLDGDCPACGHVLLAVNGEHMCVWRPCERWGIS